VNEYDKELAFRAGANAFLRKPFDRDELLSSVKAVLSEKEALGVCVSATKKSMKHFDRAAGI